jgi:hypothetical protein
LRGCGSFTNVHSCRWKRQSTHGGSELMTSHRDLRRRHASQGRRDLLLTVAVGSLRSEGAKVPFVSKVGDALMSMAAPMNAGDHRFKSHYTRLVTCKVLGKGIEMNSDCTLLAYFKSK